MKIGVSGEVGSFSEEAAEKYIRDHKLKAEIKYLISVENVLKEIDKKKIQIGIFPIENSNGGVVIEAINAMANHIFGIKDYFEIDVNHALLVKKGTKCDDIKKIASHDQALKQCRSYLRRNWPNLELMERPDTAGAAKDLANDILEDDIAVIAAARCADMYGLEILENRIQDLKFNFTTFLAVEKK